MIDAYQRNYRGTANWWLANWTMYRGVQNIDSLNLQYAGKLGHGRIDVPLALISPIAINNPIPVDLCERFLKE